MAWISCTLDNLPVGNLTLNDDSGFAYSATVKTNNPDEVTKFIAVASQERDKFVLILDARSKAEATILAQAQGV